MVLAGDESTFMVTTSALKRILLQNSQMRRLTHNLVCHANIPDRQVFDFIGFTNLTIGSKRANYGSKIVLQQNQALSRH
jgi:hypothetical protein